MNHGNGLFQHSKTCKDAEARIKNLLFFFSSLPVFGGHRGLMLSELSLFQKSLQRTQEKSPSIMGTTMYSLELKLVSRLPVSLNFFQPPQQTFTNGPSADTLKRYRSLTEKLGSLNNHVQGWNLPPDKKKNLCLLWTRWWQEKKRGQDYDGSLLHTVSGRWSWRESEGHTARRYPQVTGYSSNSSR